MLQIQVKIISTEFYLDYRKEIIKLAILLLDNLLSTCYMDITCSLNLNPGLHTLVLWEYQRIKTFKKIPYIFLRVLKSLSVSQNVETMRYKKKYVLSSSIIFNLKKEPSIIKYYLDWKKKIQTKPQAISLHFKHLNQTWTWGFMLLLLWSSILYYIPDPKLDFPLHRILKRKLN